MTESPGVQAATEAGTVAPIGSGGNRLSWAATPERVRRAIEERLGSTVIEAKSQAGDSRRDWR